MQSKALTPSDYIAELPEDRKKVMEQLRKTITDNLPEGFQEGMGYGMLGYAVPHSIYPKGYHCNPKDPLPFMGLASQKNFIAFYHMGVYADKNLYDWFVAEYAKRCKYKLDMGKSCVRFKKPEYIPYDLIGELMRKMTPSDWMLSKPLNTFLLMIIYIWTQMGFGMVILSAAIKGVPADIVEASALDGAHGWRLFRNITFPMVKGTFIVVLATGVVGALKVFDIVRTMTGGNFSTNVLANEMYSQTFVQFDQGKGSALAVVLFLLVTPILIYNIQSLRKERAHN